MDWMALTDPPAAQYTHNNRNAKVAIKGKHDGSTTVDVVKNEEHTSDGQAWKSGEDWDASMVEEKEGRVAWRWAATVAVGVVVTAGGDAPRKSSPSFGLPHGRPGVECPNTEEDAVGRRREEDDAAAAAVKKGTSRSNPLFDTAAAWRKQSSCTARSHDRRPT